MSKPRHTKRPWAESHKEPGNVLDLCCTTRDGRAKATFTSRRAARAVAKRGSRYHHARLEEYRCEFDPTRWHIRDATWNNRERHHAPQTQ